MRGIMSSRRLRVLLLLAQYIGLSAIVYFYVYLRIHTELFYLQRPHVFLLDAHYFHAMVSHPGGGMDYVAAFLSPLLAWDWLGALVLALLVALICWATRLLFGSVAGANDRVVHLLPAVFILMVVSQYMHPIQLCVGLSITLLGAAAYVRLGGYGVGVRLAAFAIGSVAVYYVTAGLYAIFACLCGWHEWSVKRQRWFGVACVLCAAGVPYAASRWPFDLTPGETFRGLLLPHEEHWLAIPSSAPKAVVFYTAALIFPLLAAAFFSWRRRHSSEASPSPHESTETTTVTAEIRRRDGWRTRWAVPLAMLLLLILADLAAFDSRKRCLLEIECNSEQQRWDEVLQWAERLPFPDPRAYDPRILYCINRALYFEGQLLDRMFAYPQVMSTPSLTLIDPDIDLASHLTPRQCSQIFFDLGRVNESEQMAYEVLEQCGNRPEVLKRLAYIYIIKGEPEAAKRFVLLLDRSLLHRGWARGVLHQLDTDPAFSGTSLATYRELVVEHDSLGDASNPETLLTGLLERNPRNRMALEYLMAHYLLTRRGDKLLANLHRLDALDYARVPRHVEEALACHLAMTGQEDLDLGSRAIQPETWRRFVEFVEVEQQSQGNPAAAFSALYPDFHDSYFFSFVFGHNISSLGVARPSE